MKKLMTFVVAFTVIVGSTISQGQSPTVDARSDLSHGFNLPDVRVLNGRATGALLSQLKVSQPIVEAYAQDVLPDSKLGSVITGDSYLLGQMAWRAGAPALDTFLPAHGAPAARRDGRRPKTTLSPDIVKLLVPDTYLPDARYDLTFVSHEFLNEVKTLVFDVQPRDTSPGFRGRVWIDEIDFGVVRFQGSNPAVDVKWSPALSKKASVRIDSWRVNVAPGLWVPAFAYIEVIDPAYQDGQRTHVLVRLWGYDRTRARSEGQFTKIEIPEVPEPSARARGLGPVQHQRRWEDEAARNLLARLERARLVGAPGSVDAVLESIMDNLLSANDLTFPAPLKIRVLLTSRLEAFSIGYNLILSRGLIDALVDEPSGAWVLAHMLGHLKAHSLVDTQFAFADRLNRLSDAELIGALNFRRTLQEEQEADAIAIELLKHSPYADKLGHAGMFLQIVQANAAPLANLLETNFGEHMADASRIVAYDKLFRVVPPATPGRLDRIAALPMGSRVAVDVWSGQADLARTPSVQPIAPRENAPLGIMPVAPYLTYLPEAAKDVAVKQ